MKKFLSLLLSIVMVFSCLSCLTMTSVSASSVIESAISWAVDIANDADGVSHLYSQSVRWGPSYDCSSLVISAFKHAGVDTGAWWTGDMQSQFTKHGFTWIPWSQIGGVSNLQRGDVLLYHEASTGNGHTEIYLGNNQNVGAHSSNRPAADQISVSGYYFHPWQGVLRYTQEPNRDIEYTVNLNDGDAISGPSFPITGNVKYGGTYPSLLLYVDYSWVATTANNEVGNYAFYLDTTKYSDGEHLIGVKIVNQDGVDFTTWRTIYIDNSKPSLENSYISQITDSGFRVCCTPTDNLGISKVRIATWTKSDQSDLIWTDCRFNGVATYFQEINRCDFDSKATKYFNHIYVYDKANNYISTELVYTYSEKYNLIKAAYLSEIKNDSYRVCCQVNNNDDIGQVKVATWTKPDQSDLIWHNCNYNGFGTYFYDVNRADYAEGAMIYTNHIYVYNKAGYTDMAGRVIAYEKNGPVISNQTVSNISDAGFRFSCKVTDENSISKVSIAVWTQNNGQDDLKWYDLSLTGDVATGYVNRSEHNNENGNYIIHTYAYDIFDNCTSVGSTAMIQNTPVEIVNDDYHGNTYTVYSSGMNWDEAKAWCEEQGGHLATITSKEEWDNVKILLEKFNGVRCWLGAESTSGEWKWVTEESFEFSNWGENQPDCSEKIEYYLGTWDTKSEILDCYLWNDYTITGDKIGGFVMEIERNSPVIGDVDGDGKVSIMDATAIQKHLVQLTTITDDRLKCADIDEDGNVSIMDATQIQKYLVQSTTISDEKL